MADLLILEFEDLGDTDYGAINELLGIDMSSGEGDWPPGLHTHAAASKDGNWVVVEIWETQEDQDDFMKSRLGPALHKAGVTKPPKRAEWSKLKAHHSPKKPSAKAK